MATSEKWADLAPRVLSAIVMVAVGGAAIVYGGMAFKALAILCTGLMVGELAKMTAPTADLQAQLVGILAGGIMSLVVTTGHPIGVILFFVVPFVGVFQKRIQKFAFFLYAIAIQFAVYELVVMRETGGVSFMVWIVLVVVASDVLGYFAGRTFGGPKFWPAVSPKKTWSGTMAGWIGAGLVGAGYVALSGAAEFFVILSMVTAFAGQMGDIAESAIKRRCGIKDSSNLIPGHGGLLDRFDALIGAALFLGFIGFGIGGM
jgi:phosphatidate cytidylyltransferase